MPHACNAGTSETKAEGMPWVQDQPGLQSETLSEKKQNERKIKEERKGWGGKATAKASVMSLFKKVLLEPQEHFPKDLLGEGEELRPHLFSVWPGAVCSLSGHTLHLTSDVCYMP